MYVSQRFISCQLLKGFESSTHPHKRMAKLLVRIKQPFLSQGALRLAEIKAYLKERYLVRESWNH